MSEVSMFRLCALRAMFCTNVGRAIGRPSRNDMKWCCLARSRLVTRWVSPDHLRLLILRLRPENTPVPILVERIQPGGEDAQPVCARRKLKRVALSTGRPADGQAASRDRQTCLDDVVPAGELATGGTVRYLQHDGYLVITIGTNADQAGRRYREPTCKCLRAPEARVAGVTREAHVVDVKLVVVGVHLKDVAVWPGLGQVRASARAKLPQRAGDDLANPDVSVVLKRAQRRYDPRIAGLAEPARRLPTHLCVGVSESPLQRVDHGPAAQSFQRDHPQVRTRASGCADAASRGESAASPNRAIRAALWRATFS